MGSPLYIVTHDELGGVAARIQKRLAAVPLQDLFDSIDSIVVEEIMAAAYHAYRGGDQSPDATSIIGGAPAPLRASAPRLAADSDSGGQGVLLESGEADDEDSDADESDPDYNPLGKKYVVRKGGKDRYPDIVWKEIPDPEIDLPEVWERLQPLVHTSSPRAYETFRRSVASDSRFKRIGDDGWRFRRMPQPSFADVIEKRFGSTNEETAEHPRANADSTVSKTLVGGGT